MSSRRGGGRARGLSAWPCCSSASTSASTSVPEAALPTVLDRARDAAPDARSGDPADGPHARRWCLRRLRRDPSRLQPSAGADALAAQGVADIDWPWTFAARVTLYVAEGRWDDACGSTTRVLRSSANGLRRHRSQPRRRPIGDVALARRDLERLRRLVDDIDDRTPHAGPVKALAQQGPAAGRAARSRVGHTRSGPREAPAGSLMESYVLVGLGRRLPGLGTMQARPHDGAPACSEQGLGTAWSDVVQPSIELMSATTPTPGAGLDAALRARQPALRARLPPPPRPSRRGSGGQPHRRPSDVRPSSVRRQRRRHGRRDAPARASAYPAARGGPLRAHGCRATGRRARR